MSSYRVIVLTEREYDDLHMIINNGWGDGDYSGWGNANPRTQIAAMRHFDAADSFDFDGVSVKTARREQQGEIDKMYHKP